LSLSMLYYYGIRNKIEKIGDDFKFVIIWRKKLDKENYQKIIILSVVIAIENNQNNKCKL